MNYDFTQKNHWRNRIWNQMAERVPCHPRDAIILYLAAETDFDRPTAIRKGFRPENLIAVDRDQSVVDGLRAEGTLAVCGDIIDVMTAWPSDVPVSGLIADFCCGLELDIWRMLPQALMAKQFVGACVAINLLRGRDPRTNHVREVIAKSLSEHYIREQYDKHRGVFAYVGYSLAMERLHEINKRPWSRMDRLKLDWHAAAIFGSYRSTAGQYFDWSLFNTLSAEYFNAPTILPEALAPLAPLRRSISAVLAHRTRRLAA